MLSYLLGLIQEFERTHGRVPILISLNTRHMSYLIEECPDIAINDEPFPFGFRICVLPEDELAHPVVSVLPVMWPTNEIPQFDMSENFARSLRWKTTSSLLTRRA